MEEKALTFTVDPDDPAGMVALMDELGDSKTLYAGVNVHYEDVNISVFNDMIVVVTFQSNGWVRKNVYWRDGTREELYEGKWK